MTLYSILYYDGQRYGRNKNGAMCTCKRLTDDRMKQSNNQSIEIKLLSVKKCELKPPDDKLQEH